MVFDITYIGHSGFCVEIDNYLLIFDYYEGKFPTDKIRNSTRTLIFASHAHSDHFNESIFRANKLNENVAYVLSDDIKPKIKTDNLKVKFMSFDEEINLHPFNIKTFDSSDEGVCFLIEYKKIKIFHAGDLNLWSWRDESTSKEIDEAKSKFYRILNSIIRETTDIDIAFFPLDSRMNTYFYEGAQRFLEAFNISHFFPMHMWEKYRYVKVLKDYNTDTTMIYPVSKRKRNFEIILGE